MTGQNIAVFSGGSAANNLVDVFNSLAQENNSNLSYIIPISDNGGSSSEIIRVFGGPGIGDVRSRLVRLIPSTPNSPTTTALSTLFNHRLSPTSPTTARSEWTLLCEGQHPLWNSIPSDKRELIRSFLILLNLEISKRARPPSNMFNFQSASLGNLFLTGARLMSGSFESAIYLLGSITGVEGRGVGVVPAVNSNFSHHICAGLRDGSSIVGQNSISHPSPHSDVDPVSPQNTRREQSQYGDVGTEFDGPLNEEIEGHHEDANPPMSHPNLTMQNIVFHKDAAGTPGLPSPIERIWYINPYGLPIHPHPNPRVLTTLRNSHTLIYSIGSLYTSIIPCLILRDVGRTIATTPSLRNKILILNGSLDRETGLDTTHPFSAVDFVKAVVDACEEGGEGRKGVNVASDEKGGKVMNDEKDGVGDEEDEKGIKAKVKERWSKYVTHIIHLTGPDTPRVDAPALKALGIECIRVYGRIVDGGMVYDGKALGQALEAIVGRKGRVVGDKSRRNTLQE